MAKSIKLEVVQSEHGFVPYTPGPASSSHNYCLYKSDNGHTK